MWFQWLPKRTQILVVLTSSISIYSAVLLLIALFSSTAQLREVSGQFGVLTTNLLLSELGLSALLIPVLLLWTCYRMLKKPSPRPVWIRVSLMLLLIASASLYLSLMFPGSKINGFLAGGFLGQDWSLTARALVGRWGSLALVTLLLFICALITGKLTLEEVYVRSALVFDVIASFMHRASAALRSMFKPNFNEAFEDEASEVRLSSTGPYKAYRSKQGTKILEPLWSAKKEISSTPSTPAQTTQAVTANLATSAAVQTAVATQLEASPALTEVTPEPAELVLETKNVKKSKKKEKLAVVIEEAVTESTSTESPESPSHSFDFHKTSKKSFAIPSTSLLSNDPKKEKKKNKKNSHDDVADKILQTLTSFEIQGQMISTIEGPRVATYEFQPEKGIKLNKIEASADDVSLSIGVPSLNVVAPIPGRATVGFEVPQKTPEVIGLKSLHSEIKSNLNSMKIPVLLGRDVYGQPVAADLTEMPHLLIAGSTGSGKSIFINTLLSTLLLEKSPVQLRMALVDPKMIELASYNKIPHLLQDVITNPDHAKDLLVEAAKEMDSRYTLFSQLGVRDITSFNKTIRKSSKKAEEKRLGRKLDLTWNEIPFVVIVVDEMADLIMTQGKEVEVPLTRIAQKARACGIHLILATQRPSAEVITGLIKANFPCRIAFKVSSSLDSRTILDVSGAEKLLGKGDMLFLNNKGELQRLHGSYISEEDVAHLTAFWKKQSS